MKAPFLFRLLVVAAIGAGSQQQIAAAAPNGDYLEIDGVTYYVDAISLVTYFNASDTCEELDMDLVRFETMDKNDIVMSTLAENPDMVDTYFWTSGRAGEFVFAGQWYWGYNKTLGPWIREFDWGIDMPFWPEYNYTSCISFKPRNASWEDHLCEYVQMGYVCQPRQQNSYDQYFLN